MIVFISVIHIATQHSAKHTDINNRHWILRGKHQLAHTATKTSVLYLQVTVPNTTVLNPVISPKLRVARFTSSLYEPYDLHEIRLTQKEALLEQKYFTGSMPLLTPDHSFMVVVVVVPKFSPLPQFIRNVVEKQARNGRNATSWKPIR